VSNVSASVRRSTNSGWRFPPVGLCMPPPCAGGPAGDRGVDLRLAS
jgi:hypothetical protein